MDFHTFSRALRLIKKFDADGLNLGLENLMLVIEENQREKKEASNNMRFTIMYYILSTEEIKKRIEEIKEEIINVNEKIKKLKADEVYFKTKSKLTFRLNSLVKEKNNLEKQDADYANKLRRNTQLLIDHYLENENTERKRIDIKNALYIIKESAKKNIHFEQNNKMDAKEIYGFLVDNGVIEKPEKEA